MRISELSRASGVPVPTIKFYLREGLLPPGRATAPNQAEYGDAHLRRLKLVRVLVEVGGLGIVAIRDVLRGVEDESVGIHEMLGIAQYALGPAVPDPPAPDLAAARADTERFLAGLGWQVTPEAPARAMLADALVALRRLGFEVPAEIFAPYAKAADEIAAWEVALLPAGGARDETVLGLVVGTVVFEAALVALRRMADEHHSAHRFGAQPERRRASQAAASAKSSSEVPRRTAGAAPSARG